MCVDPIKNMALDEAKQLIKKWPYKDDFICHHYRLLNKEGDDNSLDLEMYWDAAKKLVDEATSKINQ